MVEKNNPVQYYLFSFSNLLAAFGGGMILGKGIGIIDIPILQGGSILAFFVGSVLGLFFLQFFPKKLAALDSSWFSLFTAFVSLTLLYIFKNFAAHEKLAGTYAIIFFVLLSVRFGFWFYSRVLRAANAAGKQQKIAWVELGYYLGMILGLIIWKFIGIEIGLVFALTLDAILQCAAGFFDLLSRKMYPSTLAPSSEINPGKAILNNKNNLWSWRLASSVVLFTVGAQVIIFYLAHQVSEWFSSYIIAFYYMGVSLAALTCKKFKIQLGWKNKNLSLGNAVIYSDTNNKEIRFLMASILSIVGVLFTIIGIVHWNWGDVGHHDPINLFNRGEYFLLFLVTLSGFFYELIALAILDRIGLEDYLSNKKSMIVRTYGLMAVAAAVGLWMLGVMKISLTSLIVALIICFIVATIAIWKRKEREKITA